MSFSAAQIRRSQWALMGGNFAIGCGVMVTAGSLNDLSHALAVGPAVAGQLITVAAIVMGASAPLMAAVLGGMDRRRLLTLALAWYALGHALCALMPGFASLMVVRAATVLAAALFTPQAGAAIAHMAAPEHRGRAITTVFLGWSLSSVLGMPLHAYIGETLGWRWAFALVAALSAAGAWGVWRSLPDGVQPPALNLRDWGQLLRNPLLVGLIVVTALSGAGQFTLFSYFAPYYREVLGATAAGVSLLFLWFGAFGLLGNVVVSRWIDRIGAGRAVAIAIASMAFSLALWPLADSVATMALVLLPWALGCFSSNSAQQARSSLAAPRLAPAMLALNTSAIYAGQAIGAAGGGALIAASGYALLHWVGMAWLLLALALSLWVSRRQTRGA